MLIAKQVADLITVTRALIAFWLAWVGVTQGADGLPLAVWLMIVAWTSDSLDGPIARRSRVNYHTWVGDHDLGIDMLVSGGLLVFLLSAGFLDLRVCVLYLLIWILVFWRWGILRSLGMLFQAFIYGWFLLVSLQQAPASGWWLVVWILSAVILTWPQFPREVVPGFLNGMRVMWGRHIPKN